MELFDLSGRVALVTGGNGGIGLGMGRGLAAAGATVIVAGRNERKAAAAVAELAGMGVASGFVAVDVAREESCQAMVAETVARFGRLDILVNCAGNAVRKRPEAITLDEWQNVLDTNLSSVFHCSRAAYPEMKRAGGGKIIAIGSMMSLFASPWAGPYGAAKGGLVQLCRSFATAWAKDNIQVNVLLPGFIETDMTNAAREQVPGLYERVLARTPADRWGRTTDFAGVAVFLASPASDFITGTAIPVDGGYSIAI